MPKISIIVPVYNTEKYLRPCLDSILAQSFKDFEAVLVDDGSKDRSGAICDEYAARDSRFVVLHKQNEGVAKARITAFEHSKGELITFIDSDDYVSPEYLEKLSKPILEQDADMVSSDYYYDKNGEICEPRARLSGIWQKDQIQDFIAKHYFFDDVTQGYGMTIFLCTKMIKRQFVLDGLKQGEGMWYAEDQIGVFHILSHCKKLVLLSDRLYYYVLHEGQAIKDYNYSLWENLILLMEKYQSLDINNLSVDGRRKRTLFHIEHTIIDKMIPSGINRRNFVDHLTKVCNHPYIVSFFRHSKLGYDIKKVLFYQLLKLHCFSLLYIFLIIKDETRNYYRHIRSALSRSYILVTTGERIK
jgi:glycosyltransferase involved in cell wall biosynthesis